MYMYMYMHIHILYKQLKLHDLQVFLFFREVQIFQSLRDVQHYPWVQVLPTLQGVQEVQWHRGHREHHLCHENLSLPIMVDNIRQLKFWKSILQLKISSVLPREYSWYYICWIRKSIYCT